MKIRDVTIKTPDRKWDWWRKWCLAQKRWGFWKLEKKKTVSWDLNSERNSWDSSLKEGSRFLVSPKRDPFGSTKSAARLLKKLCLSLFMSINLKLKKVNKSFVPEPILCFSDSYMFINIMKILCLFHEFVSWSYIFGCRYITVVAVRFPSMFQIDMFKSS